MTKQDLSFETFSLKLKDVKILQQLFKKMKRIELNLIMEFDFSTNKIYTKTFDRSKSIIRSVEFLFEDVFEYDNEHSTVGITPQHFSEMDNSRLIWVISDLGKLQSIMDLSSNGDYILFKRKDFKNPLMLDKNEELKGNGFDFNVMDIDKVIVLSGNSNIEIRCGRVNLYIYLSDKKIDHLTGESAGEVATFDLSVEDFKRISQLSEIDSSGFEIVFNVAPSNDIVIGGVEWNFSPTPDQLRIEKEYTSKYPKRNFANVMLEKANISIKENWMVLADESDNSKEIVILAASAVS